MSLSDQSRQCYPTSVQVTVVQARSLRIKGKNGTNDAYAIMQVAKDKFATSVAEKSVAPVWKEEATFELPLFHNGNTEKRMLHVHVMHRALVGPDKLLGQAVINLLELSEVKSRNKTEWHKLLDKAGKPDKDRGEVQVDIQFMKNNMTASMFDLSATEKPHSRLGRFKDKVRGKKEGLSDTASAVVPSFTQVLTDSEGEGEGGTDKGEKKKKNKLKSLFSPKSNLQRHGLSQSMSVLGPLPEKNSSLSGSRSTSLNVDSSEGKNKLKFQTHKRTSSSLSLGRSKIPVLLAEQSNLCINGTHMYTEEPQPRSARTGSNFSLASSGLASMEDLRKAQGRKSSGTSMDSFRALKQPSTWAEEEERAMLDEERKKKEVQERKKLDEEQEKSRITEEEGEEMRLEEEQEERSLKVEGENSIWKEDQEKWRLEEKRREMEEQERWEEEERIRREEHEIMREDILRKEDERKMREVEERLKREKDERIKKEERIRREQEEGMQRREEEERKMREEEERLRREQEDILRKIREEERRGEERIKREAEEKMKREENRVKEEEEERRRFEEEEERMKREDDRLKEGEEEKRIEAEEERMKREDRVREEEEERRRRIEEGRMKREAEERMKREEDRVRKEEEEEERRRRIEEEEGRMKREAEEERMKREEDRLRKEEELRKIREKEERLKREEEDDMRRNEEEQRKMKNEDERRIEQEMLRKEEAERTRLEEEREEDRRRDEEQGKLMEAKERFRVDEENMKKEDLRGQEEEMTEKEKKRNAQMEKNQRHEEVRVKLDKVEQPIKQNREAEAIVCNNPFEEVSPTTSCDDNSSNILFEETPTTSPTGPISCRTNKVSAVNQRPHPVKPLSSLENQPASNIQERQAGVSTGILGVLQEKIKVKDTGVKGQYSQLTQEELISLVVKQQDQLSKRDNKIKELEQYIDNLLVRIIEEQPSILMSMNSLK
ncbi:rab11 family-interacting protein 1-like isoform X4 [Oncorhynchus masou masou]|uniref:rab11 family-interacting protein 1-like isoform X4 n=1 Tax=Oncorhynchus masou masou TaxID=90313 RepID=UPI0031831ED4